MGKKLLTIGKNNKKPKTPRCVMLSKGKADKAVRRCQLEEILTTTVPKCPIYFETFDQSLQKVQKPPTYTHFPVTVPKHHISGHFDTVPLKPNLTVYPLCKKCKNGQFSQFLTVYPLCEKCKNGPFSQFLTLRKVQKRPFLTIFDKNGRF